MTEFLNQFSQFHFLRPDWFYLLPVVLLLVWLKRRAGANTQWHQVLPAHLAKTLLSTEQQKTKQNLWFVPLLWLIAVAALAGPTWEKIEKPVFQIKRASVIVMDMSMSMRATDVKPNRLSKAKFKAIDLAKAIPDGEIALVAYAGDAFTISPLTPDNKNVINLIPSLAPEIMPEPGSYPLLGLSKAAELLQQAGYVKGDIYWFTDGIEQDDIDGLTRQINQSAYRVHVMAFGSSEGAPIQLTDNSLLKDHLGNIVIPKLNTAQLARMATLGDGVFVKSTATDLDIKTLLAAQDVNKNQSTEQQDDDKLITGDDWQEAGPYLIILLLPFVLYAFRKGVTLVLLLGVLYLPSPNIHAEQVASPNPAQTPPVEQSWTDFVFNTKDQVAAKAYQQQDFNKAQQTFDNAQWKGSAAYKANDYESALNYFQQDSSATGLYNQGNALAQLGQLENAIKAYEQSLKINPNHEQALANKTLLEQLQQEQQQQDSDQSQQQDQDQEGGQQQQSDQEQQQQNSESQNQDGEQQDSQQQDQGQQNNQPEPTNQSDEQQQQQEKGEQNSPQQGEQDEQDEQSKQAQEQESQQQSDADKQAQQQAAQMTEEQQAKKEAQQKLEQLLRKVSDDPAVLLRNKMILESRKRQQNGRPPKGAVKSW